MKKILITGGNGFIAKNLVEFLLTCNCYDVWILSRSFSDYPKSIKADFTKRLELKKILKKNSFDVIIHCAAYIPVPENSPDLINCQIVNFDGTHNLLEYSIKNNVKTFIYISSLSIFNGNHSDYINEETTPQPNSNYAISKLSAEYLCRCYNKNYKINTPILRLGTVYGLGMNKSRMINFFIKKCMNNENIEVYDSNNVLNTVYIKDVVRVIEKLIGLDGSIYHLAEDSITKREIVEIISRNLNSKSKFNFRTKEHTYPKIIHTSKAIKELFKHENSFYTFEDGIKELIQKTRNLP